MRGTENFDVWADLDGSNNLQTKYLRGDVVDQIFARYDTVQGPAWLLTDRMGSVRDVLNNGSVIKDTLVYDGFGNITSESDSTWGGRYKWTGREHDVEINLQYNRARYYDAKTGRWTSQDPLGFGAGDSNLYRYTRNRPTTRLDPSGLMFSYESEFVRHLKSEFYGVTTTTKFVIDYKIQPDCAGRWKVSLAKDAFVWEELVQVRTHYYKLWNFPGGDRKVVDGFDEFEFTQDQIIQTTKHELLHVKFAKAFHDNHLEPRVLKIFNTEYIFTSKAAAEAYAVARKREMTDLYIAFTLVDQRHRSPEWMRENYREPDRAWGPP